MAQNFWSRLSTYQLRSRLRSSQLSEDDRFEVELLLLERESSRYHASCPQVVSVSGDYRRAVVCD